jgi:NAD(P)-dependent dehydrogenase (short-subunit alcohol dehydrogenase family)
MLGYDVKMISAQIPQHPNAVVLVTGGTRGIGLAIARSFLEAGCEVIVCGRSVPTELPAHEGRQARFMACDVRDAEAVNGLFAAIAKDYGSLDVLINNAGGGPSAALEATSARLIERVLDLNLLAPLLCAQGANRLMQQNPRGGSIVNIASVAGIRPAPTAAVYGAAKAGLLHATTSLAMEWGPKVRVNAVVVGLVSTEGAAEHYGGAAGVARISAMLPLKRMAAPQDIADACLYLASPVSAYVSGAQLAVHGGGERPVFLYLNESNGQPTS